MIHCWSMILLDRIQACCPCWPLASWNRKVLLYRCCFGLLGSERTLAVFVPTFARCCRNWQMSIKSSAPMTLQQHSGINIVNLLLHSVTNVYNCCRNSHHWHGYDSSVFEVSCWNFKFIMYSNDIVRIPTTSGDRVSAPRLVLSVHQKPLQTIYAYPL